MYLHFFKRFFDILFVVIFLPFAIILCIVVIPFIYFEDKGSIFYCAQRIGKNGKPFIMFKFRTMMVNAPDIRLEDGSTFNAEDDPRVTRIGRFLRKMSIDELPQLINVLKGDMSIIGPRPDPLDWLERYTEEERVFLQVKPGITGFSQAYFRNSADGQTKLLNDIYYVRNISFLFDIKILIKTIETVVYRENINKQQ